MKYESLANREYRYRLVLGSYTSENILLLTKSRFIYTRDYDSPRVSFRAKLRHT